MSYQGIPTEFFLSPQIPQKRGELWNFLPHVLLLKNFSAIKRVVKNSKVLPFFEDFLGFGGDKKNFSPAFV